MRKLTLSLVMVGVLAGCSSQEMKTETAATPAATPVVNNQDLYEVHHDGRINVFDDAEGYKDFLATKEAPYRLTRIGAGPHGETVVFGLRSADKKKSSGIAGVDMYDGKLAGAEDFYGEVRMHGRIYVFNNLELMADLRQMGHPAYMYTDIGAGPDGETVVYVLTSKEKKKKPEATIAKFNAFYGK